MLEKVTQVAETVASRLSRREVLGKLGRSALAAAGALGASAVLTRAARADCRNLTVTCCYYYSPSDNDGSAFCVKKGITCPTIAGFNLVSVRDLRSCSDCSTERGR